MPSWTHEFSAVSPLLEPGVLAALLRRSGVAVDAARATYVRIKPGAGALVSVVLTGRDASASEVSGYLRLHGPTRAAELARKWGGDRSVPTPMGAGVRLLDGGTAVLFVFPNDAVVRGMRFVAEPDKLKRLLAELPALGGAGLRVRARASTFTLVRYKPERRLILRAHLGLRDDATGTKTERDVFVRFFADARGAELARLAGELRAGPMRHAVAEPLGAVADGRLYVEAALPGSELFAEVAGGGADPGAVVDVLVRLHESRVSGLPAIAPAASAASAATAMTALASLSGQLAMHHRELAARIGGSIPAPAVAPATLHGDCHLHQFLASPTTLGLVDFERAGVGDPAFDLGHLAAHALSSALRPGGRRAGAHFLAFARQVLVLYAARAPLSPVALRFYTACGLLERALLPCRHLEPGWQTTTGMLLAAAQHVLSHGVDDFAAAASAAGPCVVEALAASPTFFALDGRGSRPDGHVVGYPTPDRTWPLRIDGGESGRRFGVYDLTADAFVPCDPGEDARLPALRDWLPRGDLVSYRVGRRATLRVERAGGTVFVKILPQRKAARVADGLRRVASLGSVRHFPRLPQVLEADLAGGVLISSALPGVPLCEVSLELAGREALDLRLARALAALHAAPTDVAFGELAAPRSLATWCALVEPHDPVLAARCRAVAETLSSVEVLRGLVHGDLHDRNILVDGDGIGLLDFDGIGLGDVHADVGNLAAHFVLRALQQADQSDHERSSAGRAYGTARAEAWLATHARVVPASSQRAVRVQTAHALLRLACVYRFRSRHAHLAPDLVAAAADFAARSGEGGST